MNSSSLIQKPSAVQNKSSYSFCGIQAIRPDETGLKIIGGKEAIKNSWPWQVLITDNDYICGGSLIDNNVNIFLNKNLLFFLLL